MDATRPQLSANMEHYVEAIHRVSLDKGAAKARDIVRILAVKNSSVTGALKTLSAKGIVNYAPYDVITLTRKGEAIADELAQRNRVLKQFLTDVLCVDPIEAADAACIMEHALSKPLLERLTRFLEFVDSCPRSASYWISAFKSYAENPSETCLHQAPDGNACQACLGNTLNRMRP
ncbi:MAG: DtxR family transcriptional regulator [Deltaproteobacteria bacterium]|nr:MAG: DtxR family transcriptional regulator [Deltaproteobacteria bacterium]